MEIDPESLAVYLDHLIGKAGRHWVMSDFEFAPPRHDWEEEEQTEAWHKNGRRRRARTLRPTFFRVDSFPPHR